jgi:hypothetical protein
MTVRFKKNPEPCITYRVLNNVPSMQYDEYFKKYMECIEIEVMGYVPKELLTEAAEHTGNVQAIDLAIELNNQKQ